ncbi:MAG: TetR/AcrR family transcriptional regulator [Hyphomonadaceae bacterium]
MTNSPATNRRTRTYGADSRESIIKAARKLFAKHGVEAVSMADIAEAAGLSRATVFNQFGSKYLIIDEITAHTLVGYRTLLSDALADTTTTTPDLIHRLYLQMAERLQEGRRLYRDVFPEIQKLTRDLGAEGKTRQLRRECQTLLIALFERGQKRGEILETIEASTLATGFDSLLNGGVARWLAGPSSGALTPLLTDLCAVFIRGVRR